MGFLPIRRSWSWAWVWGIHAAALYAAILVSRAALHLPVILQTSVSLAVLALSLALIAAAGGWMGGRLFFLCAAAGSLVGVGYMLVISFADTAPGWGDLTSLIGFTFLSAVGIGAGLAAELIRFIVRRNKGRKP